MSSVFLQNLGLPEPDVWLEVGSGSHGVQTARALEAFESTLAGMKHPPKGVVVAGDVNSTLACALAAVKMGIPVAHVEAGLRSFDRSMPEEINRLLTDALSDLLFVSEPAGLVNLRNEGMTGNKIIYAGNVMIDTLIRELPAATALQSWRAHGLSEKQYALVTLHRPSNVDNPERLAAAARFLRRISEHMKLVFPMHPRTRAALWESGASSLLTNTDRIRLLEPLPYHDNLSLMASAALVLTDSGGIQEETTYLGVPCLTLRSNTERPCTVTLGTNTLVGDDYDLAEALIGDVLQNRYKKPQAIEGWDGRAANRIAETLVQAWAA